MAKTKLLTPAKISQLQGLRVFVFKEIKSGLWTIWDETRKKNLFWADQLTLINASFFVDEVKRKQVVKNRHRFPHAGVYGIIGKAKSSKKFQTEIYYNPFLTKSFVTKNRNQKVQKATKVLFEKSGKVFI